MDNSSFLNFLSAIISALITTTGAVLIAYLGRKGEKKPDPSSGGILKPPGYVPRRNPKAAWGKWAFFILLSLTVLTLLVRLTITAYFETSSETIPFISDNNATELHPSLEWEAGSSATDAYHLAGQSIEITAGPYTWPNFPMLHYKPTIAGDFSVSVKMNFLPDAPILETAQMAGILIHPLHEHLAQGDEKFPSDWIAVSKNVTQAGSLVGCRGSWVDYPYSDPVFLRIERIGGTWRCAYSGNGENWSYLTVSVNDVQLGQQELAISLFAYSDTGNPIQVTFSDWIIRAGK